MISLRRVSDPQDAAADGMIALYQAAFAEPPYLEIHHAADVRRHTWTAFCQHCLVVAERRGEVVGFACALRLSEHTDPTIPDFVGSQPDFGGAVDGTVYMAELAVASDARGERLGSRLVDARLAWARDQGLAHFVMRTDPDRSLSARIYVNRGAQPLGQLQDLGSRARSASRYRRFFWGAV